MSDVIICYCCNVTKGKIISAIKCGARTLEEIQKLTGAGTGRQCAQKHPEGRCCIEDIMRLIRDEA